MEPLSEATAQRLGLSEHDRMTANRGIAEGMELSELQRVLNPFFNNSSSSSSSKMDASLLAATVSRLEAQKSGAIPDTSRPAIEDFQAANATRKKGKKTRTMAKSCYGYPRCTNALCEHQNVVAYIPTPEEIAKEANILKTLIDHCERQGYHVSELYAKQSLFARDWKIADAWKAVKTNIDERESKFMLTGRTNWVRVNLHADKRPTNPLGANEPRNERIKYLEDDDAGLHDILSNNWNSSYGKDIKEQFPKDKIKQKRQYQLYRREAYYRAQRAKFQKGLSLNATVEERATLMSNFDDLNEPRYNLDLLPDEEDVKNAEATLAHQPEPEPGPEPEKPLGPYTKMYNELRAKMVREGNPPTSGWLLSHGNVDESSNSPSADPAYPTVESIPEDDGDSEYVDVDSAISSAINLPPMPRMRSHFAPPSLTLKELQEMSQEDQQFQFLIRPHGRDMMYEKFNQLGYSLKQRIETLQYLLQVHTQLDEISKEAIQLELLKYQSHSERLEAKDYKTIEKLPTGHQIVQFDTRGDEANETKDTRETHSEDVKRLPRPLGAVPYEPPAQQPEGFLGLGFQREELERIIGSVKTAPLETPEGRQSALDRVGAEFKRRELEILHKDLTQDEEGVCTDMVMNFRNDPARQKMNFGLPIFPEPKVEEAKETEETDEQEPEPGLSEKGKGKQPIRPWEQNVEHKPGPIKFPSPIMKAKHPKSKKRPQSLFKELSKQTIESKLEEMGIEYDDDIVEKIRQASANGTSRMSSFKEDFDIPEADLNEDDTVNATHDPDAEEGDVDDFFADDTTGMDDLQEPFPDFNEESAASAEPTISDRQEDIRKTATFSGARVPPAQPTPEPLTDVDKALHKIALKTIELTNSFPTLEREFFKKLMELHNLATYKLSTGPFRAEDVGVFLAFVQETPAEGISIELICKLLGLCDNNPVRAHEFFKTLCFEVGTYFGSIGIKEASWLQFETMMMRWEVFYWHVLLMMVEVMKEFGIEWTLA